MKSCNSFRPLSSLNITIISFIVLTSIIISHQQHYIDEEANPCLSKETCSECITSNGQCAWCRQDGFSSEQGRRRCDYIRNLERGGCFESQIYHPGHTVQKLIDLDLSNKTGSEEDAIQMKPQRIHLKLKPNSPYNLKVQFRQAVDYPVDLYYLMDLSKSMEDDKAKLAELGTLLASEMQRITSNFRLGFGSFVDKVVMPYVSVVPEKLREPCSGCAAPYGFKNHMQLDKQTEAFASEVERTRISGNLDAPEGGFDAIMQAIVCKTQIGWREKSRKLLVFSTDSGFHYAGDGKLGGIVKPNDGKCHLDGTGEYTESTTQDYPSISQINRKATEYHVNLIFAVTAGQFDIYKQLTPLIEGSSAGQLMNDSSNVVDLIKNEYEKITSSIELKDNATMNNVKISYYSSCVGQKREETNICSGLKVGTTVNFDAIIEVTSCPRNRELWNQTIKIYPVGLDDALYIDLEIICECDCEKPWNEEKLSQKCSNGNGTYECGICSCYGNRYGRDCECDAKDSDPAKDELACFRDLDTKACAGRGVCRCGVCECFQKSYEERIYGQFCECDNFSCDRAEGKVCSGPEHGTCDCGLCKCNADWTGSACECRASNDTCLDPKTQKICSGRGECQCGECKCSESPDGLYTGKYCEECPTCKTQCEAYKECVQCQRWETGPLTKEECALCPFNAVDVDKLNVQETDTHCIFIDDDDCKFQFKYESRSMDYPDIVRPIVHVQSTKECPTPVNILAIVIGVILGIVLVGLALLLIWKLLTTIHDRREFAKFEKERMMAKWDTGENPIYKQATTTFKNPTYGGKQ
ncbi:Integrin beta-PS [Halotydeus destructor]|nr:Integrin beta-PS [Halotydeus destructor]